MERHCTLPGGAAAEVPFDRTAPGAPPVAVSAVGRRIIEQTHARRLLERGAVASILPGAGGELHVSVTGSSSVTTSRVLVHATGQQLARTCTSAPFVALGPMETRPSPVDELHAIITPFDADAFGRILVQYNLLNDFPNIIQNLMNGFSIFNSTPVISEVFTPPNRKSATDHAEFVNNYFTSEAGVGRITGPYTHDQVREIFKSNGGFFRTSPIGVVPKPRKPGQLQDQYRMVMDLSAPDSHGVSVNSLIDADDFQARWDGARVKGDYVATCPLGTRAAGGDVEAAYRCCPLSAHSKAFMVWLDLEGRLWVNHCLMFGVTSGAGICGQALEPVRAILEAQGMGPIFKWVDDFDFLAEPLSPDALRMRDPSLPLHTYQFLIPIAVLSPMATLEVAAGALPVRVTRLVDFAVPAGFRMVSWSYPYDLGDVRRSTAPLCLPWAESKWIEFAFRTVYMGFLWDYWNRRVSLPDDKRLKYFG